MLLSRFKYAPKKELVFILFYVIHLYSYNIFVMIALLITH